MSSRDLHQCTYGFLLLLHLLWSPPANGQEFLSPPPAQRKSLTLNECVLLAARHNRDIRSARLDRVVQKFDLKVEEDKFHPNVTLTPGVGVSGKDNTGARYYQRSARIKAEADQKLPAGTELNFTWEQDGQDYAGDMPAGIDDPDTGTNWRIRLSQPLLKGAGTDVNRASVETARLTEQIHVLALRADLIRVITDAITAYRNLIQAYMALDIQRNSLDRAQDLLRINEELIAAKRMAPLEIVQTQADVADKKFQALQAENNVEQANLELLRILDLDQRFRLTPTAPPEPREVMPDMEKCIHLARQNRSEYLQARLRQRIAKQALIVARNNLQWALSLDGNYGRVRDAKRSDWKVALALEIPLYGEMTRRQQFLRATAEMDKSEIAVAESADNITMAVMDAVRNVKTKWRQVELARQARALTEQKLDIEREKLRVGRSTTFQLVTFQNDLVTARNNLLNVTIEYQNALSDLDRVVGATLETWKIKVNDEYPSEPGQP